MTRITLPQLESYLWGAATVLRFTPDAPLVKGAYYTATVVGAVDLAGNVLAEAYEWVGGAGRRWRHPQRAGGAGAQVLRLWRPAGGAAGGGAGRGDGLLAAHGSPFDSGPCGAFAQGGA